MLTFDALVLLTVSLVLGLTKSEYTPSSSSWMSYSETTKSESVSGGTEWQLDLDKDRRLMTATSVSPCSSSAFDPIISGC